MTGNHIISWLARNALRLFVGASIAGLTLVLAIYNVRNWAAEGFVLLASIAAFSEAIGLSIAVMIEAALREGRKDRALACFAILALCVAFNVVGGARAWDASEETKLETAVNVLEKTRAARQGEIDQARATVQGEIDKAKARIDAKAALLPDGSVNAYRQREMRANWEAATSDDRRQVQAAQAKLDQMPVTAAPVIKPAPQFDAATVAVAFLLVELVLKGAGLWACGFAAFVAPVPATGQRPMETAPPTETHGAVVPFPQETPQELVARLRSRPEPVSFGEIERRFGILKGTACKWEQKRLAAK